MDEEKQTLVVSAWQGRYALDDPFGPDLTSGMTVDVCIAGQWIAGRIEYDSGPIYTLPGPQTLASKVPMPSERGIGGYYLQCADGSVCGLCAGMQVKV